MWLRPHSRLIMAGLRVLVIDDELTVRQLLTALLGRLGHTSETVSNAAEALSKVEHTEFDLVLTDFDMPGTKGDELAREIKRRRQGIPVVLVTGCELQVPPQGIDRVLFKPFSLQELEATISSFT
jgi:CheY-like chemotaxis protein